MNAPGPLRDRITHWTGQGYRVVSETPTSAQLVRPKRFNFAEFLAVPLYAFEYLGQRELDIYLSVDGQGQVSETGSGLDRSAYRRAQSLSGPMRLAWVVVGFVVFILIVLAIQAVT